MSENNGTVNHNAAAYRAANGESQPLSTKWDIKGSAQPYIEKMTRDIQEGTGNGHLLPGAAELIAVLFARDQSDIRPALESFKAAAEVSGNHPLVAVVEDAIASSDEIISISTDSQRKEALRQKLAQWAPSAE